MNWQKFKSLPLTQLCLALTLIGTGLIVTLIQLVIYLFVRPFNPEFFRRLNFYVSYSLNAHVAFLVDWWSDSRPVIFVNPKDFKEKFGNEHAFCLLNHGFEAEWLMGWSIADRVKVLGNVRAYAKRILQYAPILGWSWKLQEYVFLDRNWEKDQINLKHQLKEYSNYPISVWLTLFAEGTRFTKKKYEASMEVAKEKDLPLLKHHLLPRTRGFTASMPHLREKFPAIYDWVIVPHVDCKNDPTVFSIVSGKPVKSALLIRRIPCSEVPEEEKEAALWLHKLFQEKDRVMDNYIRTGEFVPKSEAEKEEYSSYKGFKFMEIPRRTFPLINFIFWASVVLLPLASYILRTAVTGSWTGIILVSVISLSGYLGFSYLMNLSKISTGSTYGTENKEKQQEMNGNKLKHSQEARMSRSS